MGEVKQLFKGSLVEVYTSIRGKENQDMLEKVFAQAYTFYECLLKATPENDTKTREFILSVWNPPSSSDGGDGDSISLQLEALE